MTIEEVIIENNAIALVKITRARCGHDDAQELRECAKEHKQIALWLSELIDRRDAHNRIYSEIIDEFGMMCDGECEQCDIIGCENKSVAKCLKIIDKYINQIEDKYGGE